MVAYPTSPHNNSSGGGRISLQTEPRTARARFRLTVDVLDGVKIRLLEEFLHTPPFLRRERPKLRFPPPLLNAPLDTPPPQHLELLFVPLPLVLVFISRTAVLLVGALPSNAIVSRCFVSDRDVLQSPNGTRTPSRELLRSLNQRVVNSWASFPETWMYIGPYSSVPRSLGRGCVICNLRQTRGSDWRAFGNLS